MVRKFWFFLPFSILISKRVSLWRSPSDFSISIVVNSWLVGNQGEATSWERRSVEVTTWRSLTISPFLTGRLVRWSSGTDTAGRIIQWLFVSLNGYPVTCWPMSFCKHMFVYFIYYYLVCTHLERKFFHPHISMDTCRGENVSRPWFPCA